MPTIQINKPTVNDLVLSPISRISEECGLVLTNDSISSLVNDAAASIILYVKLKARTGLLDSESLKLNIKDVRKLSKVFNCIQDNDFELKVSDNASTVSHKSPSLSFKLHLVNDTVLKKTAVSLDKILNLSFDSEFTITSEKLNEVLKGAIFATSTDKVYFFTKENTVHAELTDKANADEDTITFNISNEFTGTPIVTPLPFSMEVLKIVNSNKFDKIKVRINNTYKILLFEISDERVMYKYIVSGFTK